MDRISSLLAVAALALITSARAQDESTTPAPASSEENSSSNIQAPSSLRGASSPSGETKRAPATDNETTEKPATPVASPAKNAAPAGPVHKKEAAAEEAPAGPIRPDKGKPESVVKKLETQWEESVRKHDISFITARVASDFIGVSSKGRRIDKAALLKAYGADSDSYSSARNTDVMVRSYGPNVAVATGLAKEVGKTNSGAAFNRSYLWTDTWMLRGEQWQCVASHVMVAPASK